MTEHRLSHTSCRQTPPPHFGTSGVQGAVMLLLVLVLHVQSLLTSLTVGRGVWYGMGQSNENDLCFYSRQSLFSTVQVTEFQLL